MNSTRYTLTIPDAIYDEIRGYATKHDKSIKEVVRQCLKFGLIAMNIGDNPNSEIVFREKVQETSGEFSTRETRIQFV